MGCDEVAAITAANLHLLSNFTACTVGKVVKVIEPSSLDGGIVSSASEAAIDWRQVVSVAIVRTNGNEDSSR